MILKNHANTEINPHSRKKESKTYVHNNEEKEIKYRLISKLASQNNLYSNYTVNGERNVFMEKMFGTIESKFAVHLNKFLSQEINISEELFIQTIYFCAMMIYRTPENVRFLNNIFEKIISETSLDESGTLTPENIAHIKRSANGVGFQALYDFSTQPILHELNSFNFAKFCYYHDDCFLISDNFCATGKFEENDYLFFPYASNMCLVLAKTPFTNTETHVSRGPITQEQYDCVNRAIAASADQYLYCKDEKTLVKHTDD